ATDTAGNTGAASDAVAVTIDTVNPAAPVIVSAADDSAAADGITNDATQTLTITAEAGTTVQVYDGDTLLGTATEVTAGNYSFVTDTLSEGGHSFTATATDTAGNTGAASDAVAVTIDTINPDAPVIVSAAEDSAAADGITNDATQTLTITAEAGTTVQVYDGATLLGTATEGTAGTYSFVTATLSEGGHSFTATATDTAGNTGAASDAVAVTIDTVNPDAPVITSAADDSAAADGITNDATQTLTIAAEAGTTVKVYDGATLLGTATEGTPGNYS